MNFSHKGIQNRKHQLESAATHRLHKLQLIGIRLTLIGLIFVGLFAGSFLIGMYTSILSSTPDVNSIQRAIQRQLWTVREIRFSP